MQGTNNHWAVIREDAPEAEPHSVVANRRIAYLTVQILNSRHKTHRYKAVQIPK